MSATDNPFDSNPFDSQRQKPKPKPKQKPSFASGLEHSGVTEDEAHEATTGRPAASKRGQYWQRTLRLPPEWRTVVRGIQEEIGEGIPLAEIERWIFGLGLEAVLSGSAKPQLRWKEGTHINTRVRGLELFES